MVDVPPAIRAQTLRYLADLALRAVWIVAGMLLVTVTVWLLLRLAQWLDEHGWF